MFERAILSRKSLPPPVLLGGGAGGSFEISTENPYFLLRIRVLRENAKEKHVTLV